MMPKKKNKEVYHGSYNCNKHGFNKHTEVLGVNNKGLNTALKIVKWFQDQ